MKKSTLMQTLLLVWLFMFNQACQKNFKTEAETDTILTNSNQTVTPVTFIYQEVVPKVEDAVIYQVNPRFFDNSARGQKLKGIKSRLDHIAALGTNVLYLMPFYKVTKTNKNHEYVETGSLYSIRDYAKIDSAFGTLADLRNLVNDAHQRGMAVMIDWVANHTAWDHSWITTHNDWYKKNASGEIMAPNSAWLDVAQLDHSKPALRTEMVRLMKYWVDSAFIDGFRCDYAQGPGIEFWTDVIQRVRSSAGKQVVFLAEGKDGQNLSQAKFDYNFGFDFYDKLKSIYRNSANSAQTIIDPNISEFSNAVPGKSSVVRYTTNHDVNAEHGAPQEAGMYYNVDGALSAFVEMAFHKGVPMIYNGQEFASPRIGFSGPELNWSNMNIDFLGKQTNLIQIRKNSKAVRYGAITDYSVEHMFAFLKNYNNGEEQVFVLSNPRNGSVSFQFPAELSGKTWYNLVTKSTTPISLGASVNMPAFGYLIIGTKQYQ